MTRFDEVARLMGLEKKAEPAPWAIKTPEHNDGYQEAWIVGPDKTGVMPVFDDVDDHLNVAMRNAAPWLLEAATCFQPGDADLLHWMRTAEGDVCDGSLEEVHDAIESLLIRLQKAAEIMEELE